jgi:hypothetical protein
MYSQSRYSLAWRPDALDVFDRGCGGWVGGMNGTGDTWTEML